MKRIILTISGALLAIVVLAAIWFFVIRPRTLKTDESINGITAIGTLPQNANSGNGVGGGLGDSGVTADARYEEEVVRKELSSKSRIFIERIGSYSSHSSLSNIADLYYQMTEELRVAIDEEKVRKEQNLSERATFIGYTISPISIVVKELSLIEGTATVEIGAQRETTNELDEVLKVQENYAITWQKQENGEWLANGFNGNF
jgi:hypothetical protein